MLNLADLEGGESFDPAWLGQAEEVCQERVAEEELLLVRVRPGSLLPMHLDGQLLTRFSSPGLQDQPNCFHHPARTQLLHA